jgi:hypothetical protein
LYKEMCGEELFEFTLAEWSENLEAAEVAEMGEVSALVNDKKLRQRLDGIAHSIRGSGLEPAEWVVFSALVAAEGDRKSGIKTVRSRLKAEWDEITVIARSETLPSTIEEFAAELRSGDLPLGSCMAVLDCFGSCVMCGDELFAGADDAVAAVLAYYKKQDDKWGLRELLEASDLDEGDWESPNMCSHCAYILEKD